MGTQQHGASALWQQHRKKILLIGNLVVIALGCVFLAASLRYQIGPLKNPGPGLVPTVAGAAFVLFAVAATGQYARSGRGGGQLPAAVPAIGAEPDERDNAERQRHNPGRGVVRAAGTLVVGLAYVVILPQLGLATTAFALTAVLMLIGGYRKYWLIVLLAVVAGFGSQYVFISLLHLDLPESAIGALPPFSVRVV